MLVEGVGRNPQYLLEVTGRGGGRGAHCNGENSKPMVKTGLYAAAAVLSLSGGLPKTTEMIAACLLTHSPQHA